MIIISCYNCFRQIKNELPGRSALQEDQRELPLSEREEVGGGGDETLEESDGEGGAMETLEGLDCCTA